MINRRLVARASIPMAVVSAFLGSVSASAVSAQEPAVIRPVAPTYPRAAERREIEGAVTVSIDVDENGKVIGVSVVEAQPPGVFDAAATNAVQRWRFESGKPATGVLKIIRFQLEG